MKIFKTTDPEFLLHIESCIVRHGEVLVVFRYPNAGGAKEFIFFRRTAEFVEASQKLPSRTWIVSYGEPQLPLRGVVDDNFIERACGLILDGREYLIVCMEKSVLDYPHYHHEYYDYDAGETHEELREDLNGVRGKAVAVGLYPPWAEENEYVTDAVVADADGEIRFAAY